MTFTFSVWMAVSSKSQVNRKTAAGEQEDKESLPNQERLCIEAGTIHGWRDTGLRYVASGQSRTRYVNLTDAEKDIPDLHRLLEDAKAGKYNLLVLYDFNRLRSLMKPVKKVLENYGVQIYSVNQRNELQPPENFHPETSDDTMLGVHELFSDLQVKDLRRKYKQERLNFVDTLNRIRDIPDIDLWMHAADPAEVSKQLRDLCECINITPEGDAVVKFRA